MRPRLALLAAFSVLAVASSAQAVPCDAPPLPPVQPPPCFVWPPPEQGGILGEVEAILHTMTQATCNSTDGLDDVATTAYAFVLQEVQIVTESMRGPVDATQDNVCTFVYGEPEPPKAVACRPLVPECPNKVPPY